MGEALLDLGGAHFGGIAFCPVKVGLLGAVGGMFEAQDVAHLVEEFVGWDLGLQRQNLRIVDGEGEV